MPTGSLSTAVRIKYFYDDALGVPVDITQKILSMSNVKISGLLEETTPFGVRMQQMTATGRGKMDPITIGGLLKTVDIDSLDTLFGGRLPEDPDTPTRTFTVDWIGDGSRTMSYETNLQDYDRVPNNQNGLTRVNIVLQPTGEVTEVFPT